ncbi:MAG TPA: AAA family ATPase [Candidatus Limnocylindrales bacterium]
MIEEVQGKGSRSADQPGGSNEPTRRSVLVGRERELAVLRHAFERARSGEGSLVLFVGEAGIGKTRLAEALGAEARSLDGRVVWGRSWEAGGAPAYWPWLQAIRACFRDMSPASLRQALGTGAPDVARILPELRDLLPDLPEEPYAESDEGRFKIYEATTNLLRNLGAERPLLLILEDLHAADEPSLRLLLFLASDMALSHLLVVATYRSEELGDADPRRGLLAELDRLPAVQRLSLGGLTEREISSYVELVAGRAPPPGLAETVHLKTEGNPLFVGELVRLLADEGRLERASDGIEHPFAIPEGVRAVIGRRLARLSRRCHDLLSTASVIGVEVPVDLLVRLESQPPETFIELLHEAAAVRILDPPLVPGRRWRFSHALIRDVLYADLAPLTRMRLHGLVGEALETLSGNGDPPLAELAKHFVEAGNATKAIEYAGRAAEQAMRIYAYEEAARLYRLALDVGEANESERCRLLLGLGQAAMRGGDQLTMRAAFLEAAALAERLGRPEDLARAAIGYGGQLVHRRAGDDPRLIPLLEHALDGLPRADSALRARLMARLAGALRDEPSLDRRANLSAEAMAMARRLDDPIALGFALQARSAAIWGPDSLSEMSDLVDEIERLARIAGDRERVAENHWMRTVLLHAIGVDVGRFRAETDAGMRLAAELRQPALIWYGIQWTATVALNEARIADAEALIANVQQAGDRAVPWDAAFSVRVGLIALRREQGRLEEVIDHVREAVVDFPGYRLLSCLTAYVEAATGHAAVARRALEEIAADDYGYLPRDLGWPFGMMFLGETALILGDDERAAEILTALRPYADLFATASGVIPAGPVGRLVGVLAGKLGNIEDGLGYLERAARACERTGARLWAIRIAVDEAGLLIRRGLDADLGRARLLLLEATETCDSLGLVAIGRQAQSLSAELASAAPAVAGSDVGPHTQVPAHEIRTARAPSPEPTFRREGDYWAIDFGSLFRLRNARGLQYLAVLLANPGHEFHALDLVSRIDQWAEPSTKTGKAAALGLRMAHGQDQLARIDEEARAAYRKRLRDLQVELEEAQSFNDPVRLDRAQAEIDALEAELSAAFGLGGKARAVGSSAERARQSVTKAIGEARRRISLQDARLGDHLARSVHTGQFCVYDPDPGATPTWRT